MDVGITEGRTGSTTECRWCLSHNIHTIAFGAKARWIVETPSSDEVSCLMKCDDCGLVYFSKSFSDAELRRMYSGYRGSEYQRRRARYEPWYSEKINNAIGHSSDVLTVRLQHLESLLSDALTRNLKKVSPPTRVLDVGGDEGQFIPRIDSIIEKAVLEVSGVRPVDGARVFTSWSEAANFSPDMIMMCHVLEHVESARENVENALSILQPGGLLYIEIPLDRPSNIGRVFSRPVYMGYTRVICKVPLLFVVADLLSLVSRRFFGRPVPGSVMKQNEHINFFDGATIASVVEVLGFELLRESVYKPSSGVSILDVSASGSLFMKK
jgi:hypothetical protein